jgi:Ca2+-binding EF-hand superfamily protein
MRPPRNWLERQRSGSVTVQLARQSQPTRPMKTRTSTLLLLSSTLLAGFGVVACQRDEVPPAPRAVTEGAPATAPSAQTPRETQNAALTVPYVGSCEPSAELSGMVSRFAATADANGDGRIDKQEAYSSADFLVGGFFFRADADNDGTISPEEGRSARSELAARHPQLALAIKTMAGPDAAATTSRLAEVLGVDYGKPVNSKELREIGHQAVDQLFATADRDKNGSLTRAEAEEAGRERLRMTAQATFKAADENQDQKVVLEEFRAALERPVRQAFELADINKDGSLTTAEAADAARAVLQRLGAPMPADQAKTGSTPTTQ